MSIQAWSWVIDRSTHGGNALLILLMIANECDSDGVCRQVTMRKIASSARLSERTISRVIAKTLEPSGELLVTRWVTGDAVSNTPKHTYRLPGVVRDGYDSRGIPAKRHATTPPARATGQIVRDQPDKLSGRQPDKLSGINRTNRGGQPDTALSGDKEPFSRNSNTTPPYPPASGGGDVKTFVEVPVLGGKYLIRSTERKRVLERFMRNLTERGILTGANELDQIEYFRNKGFDVIFQPSTSKTQKNRDV